MKLPTATTRNLEAEISARLAYLEIIQSLEKRSKKLERSDLDMMTSAMCQQYRTLVEQQRTVSRSLDDQLNKINLLRTKLQVLATLRSEEERRHAENIRMLSELATSRSSSSPPAPAPGSTRGVFYSSLFSLSGQLGEYCSGAQGSQLVIQRISRGSSQERNLLWAELGLPGSLLSILLTGNTNFSKVVLVLAQVDLGKREAIMREVSKSQKNIETVNSGFLEDIKKLV